VVYLPRTANRVILRINFFLAVMAIGNTANMFTHDTSAFRDRNARHVPATEASPPSL